MPQLLSNLPVGAKVKDLNTKYYGKSIVFQIIDKNHPGYPANSVTLITERIITLKAFDAKAFNVIIRSERLDIEWCDSKYFYRDIQQPRRYQSYEWSL